MQSGECVMHMQGLKSSTTLHSILLTSRLLAAPTTGVAVKTNGCLYVYLYYRAKVSPILAEADQMALRSNIVTRLDGRLLTTTVSKVSIPGHARFGIPLRAHAAPYEGTTVLPSAGGGGVGMRGDKHLVSIPLKRGCRWMKRKKLLSDSLEIVYRPNWGKGDGPSFTFHRLYN